MNGPQVHEDSIDGVRTFWVDAPAPFAANLSFRVGWADETLRLHGVTHLIEHLSLSSIGSVPYAFNGSVGLNQSMLMASGAPEEIRGFLGTACAAVANLPFDRIETEVGILEAEDAPRRASAHDLLLADLFGFAGPGVHALPEYALTWIGPHEAAGWAAAHFTADNAVLALTGAPPSGLELPLPRGSRRPPVMPPLQPDIPNRRSRRRRTSDTLAAVGAVGRRSVVLMLAADILRERLFQRLRQQLGLVYRVDADYAVLDADHAFVFTAATVDERHARRASTEMLGILESLVRDGPDPAEFEQARARELAWAGQPDEVLATSLLWMQTRRALHGDPPLTLDGLRAEYDAADPAQVREALDTALENGLVMVSPQVGGFENPLIRSDLPAEGRRFKRKGAVPRLLSRVSSPPPGPEELAIGGRGVSVAKQGRWVTLASSDIAVTEWREGPVVSLLGASGRWLSIDAREWSDPSAVIRALDRMVPRATDVPQHRGDRRTWRPAPG